MNQTLPAFQQFQMAFGRRCRDPRAARPAGVPLRNMRIYEELLFNNLTGFLDACFPVCRTVIGDACWRRLNRVFFREWCCSTPIFREIPGEFLAFLAATKFVLPAWFGALAHYEWIELAVDTHDSPYPPHEPQGDTMLGIPLLNPSLMNLEYAWPVHRIGPAYRPRKAKLTQLVVFRDAADRVAFAEINPITARLIQLLATGQETGATAILRLAEEVPAATALAVRQHGRYILENLRRQGAILGVIK